MAVPDKSLFHLFLGLLKSLVPWRAEPANVSRDFWMPDESCRVCYECDTQFTVLNRRHHCRHCGRIFCGKCTANRVPAPSSEPWNLLEERKKVRVCNFCFKQWENALNAVDNGNSETQAADLDISCSPSATSFLSPKSSVTVSSSSIALGSGPSSVRFYQRSNSSVNSSYKTAAMERNAGEQDVPASENSNGGIVERGSPNPSQFLFHTDRSGDHDEFQAYQLDSKTGYFPQVDGYFGQVEFDDIGNDYESHKVHHDGEIMDTKSISSSSLQTSFCAGVSEQVQQSVKKEDQHDMGDECEAPPSSSIYDPLDVDVEPVDFENNGLLWLPPEPEDEEDDREALFFDDEGDAVGDWGYLRSSSSFSNGEHQTRDKANEEHKNAMKNVVDGHFRALVAQLLHVENLPFGDENDKESWLEIITSLSWEAATLLKPDMSKGGGMDPGGYVKVKCLASGQRSESMVIKGVVCKKNVAHRRMSSKIGKARMLILGGALEYQRVSNLLSSFDTLLQQEMDHLKMAVAKIDVHQPDVLLVEKSVSRFAQEYLLAKDISLVLNVKKPLLERIARCTGGQIVPSIDHLSSPKLGYCDMFHVDRFLEEHGSAGQGGKKLVKTLMYFEGCPKPLGCTILLRGASGDDLKKVKHVVQYSIFAAYHLALETSFLADEGASLPELPLNSPITVAFPDKTSSIDRSISMIPGFTASSNETSKGPEPSVEPLRSSSLPASDLSLPIPSASLQKLDPALPHISLMDTSSLSLETKDSNMVPESQVYAANSTQDVVSDELMSKDLWLPQTEGEGVLGDDAQTVDCIPNEKDIDSSGISAPQRDVKPKEEPTNSKEEFPPSPSDHQSILVSLSSRCVWKGTVCERSHLFRIKYYGNFDKPLGRFLRDHLFDQSYRCPSCDMPSEAHVHCYTHRQGTLTISVKKLPEFLLPGERDGKIWMWHRCLRCPRNNGFPPATRRVVMSDAAWGLSLGKFLELSFSNHAAASRVASCGHSLHRDCLRFYGFGNMVACFRYASIDVHSVYLPPHKLDFNHENLDWIQKEITEVNDRADLLFSEILNALGQMKDKRRSSGVCNSGRNLPNSRCQVTELEVMLQNEKVEFKELVQKLLTKEVKKGQLVGDILEINRLRRQLLFQSYMWDHRLIYASSLDKNIINDETSSALELVENPVSENSRVKDMNEPMNQGKASNGSESVLEDVKLGEGNEQGGTIVNNSNEHGVDHQRAAMEKDSTIKKEKGLLSVSSVEIRIQSDLPKPDTVVRRTASESQVSVVASLSDTLDAAWTGEIHAGPELPKPEVRALSESAVADPSIEVAEARNTKMEDRADDQNGSKLYKPTEDSISWLGMPFINFYRSWNKNFLGSTQKLDTLGEYNPVFVSSFRELELLGGARLLLPVGVNDTVIPVYDDEPTSIIAYALVSPEYLSRVSDEYEKPGESFLSADLGSFQSFQSFDETALESFRSIGSTDDSFLSMPGSRSSSILDPLSYTKALHARLSFFDDGPIGKVKYSVTCYYAKRFEALRRICCPSEMDFVRSLSRCKKWGAQGGKSNVFFAKTLDDRFIIKQVTKTELESFIKFAPEYFKYLSESIGTGSPTCLAKILGIYQVTSKHLKGGKDTKMDVLVMENLLYGRNVIRLYDLKGSTRSRYNPDSSGSNKVLLDQNLIEAMPTSPIFVGNKAKRLLERAVWNDTSFLASVDVMDYSLLVGVDQEKNELVLGIIDFMRQYTWDKHLETWVKASGILGGPKNAPPTVISPKQYKKRFRKAMTTYFLMLPDQWSPPTSDPTKSQTDHSEDKPETETPAD